MSEEDLKRETEEQEKVSTENCNEENNVENETIQEDSIEAQLANANAKIEELQQRRKDKQPLEYPSCGSAFKRPAGHFAGALIQEAGLKGFSIGGAQVSEKHAGFVINKGGATAEDVKAKTDAEIAEIVNKQFAFDNFKWQKETKLRVAEPFRADYLHRVLYKCPHCGAEGKMHGEGISLICRECGKAYTLDEYGYLRAEDGDTKFDHIPDWYKWQRECIRKEVLEGTYGFDVPCDIFMIVNTKDVYRVGEGRVQHNLDGLHLTGCDGRLDYSQSSKSMYTVEAALHWYTLGDVIGMGNNRALYFAMPKEDKHVVGKARLGAEEIYKILNEHKKAKKEEAKA